MPKTIFYLLKGDYKPNPEPQTVFEAEPKPEQTEGFWKW